MKTITQTAAVKNIDQYLAPLPEETRLLLEELRQTIRETAPDAEEVISYQIPTFKYHGMLVSFAAFKNHCSFFVGGTPMMEELKDKLKKYKTSKATIQFTLENPLPSSLVKKFVKARIQENLNRKKKKQIRVAPTKKKK